MSGGCATTKDQMEPRTDTACQRPSVDWHTGHITQGGKRMAPQLAPACTRSSPAAVPS